MRQKSKLRKIITVICGTFMVAFAIRVFYIPNRIVNGGVSGFSTILFHLFQIPSGVTIFVINFALLVLAWKFLGISFVNDLVLGSLLLSLFVEILSVVPPMTHDLLLASVFGSALYGIGIGLTLIEGASTGGTDILSRLIQQAFPHIKVGSLLLMVDATVIGTSLIAFREIDLAFYGAIALFLSSFSVNTLISKLNVSKLAFVVSDAGEEIARELVSNSPRGITIVDSVGAFTMESKKLLLCALKESAIPGFQRDVLRIDKKAFIIYSESQQIVGNGFQVYR